MEDCKWINCQWKIATKKLFPNWYYLATLVFFSRCRHGAIAKFFGDDLPFCNKQCDYCDKKEQTQKEFEQFQQNICATSHSQRFQGKTGIVKVSSGLDPDLYGGGRNGIKALVFSKAMIFG